MTLTYSLTRQQAADNLGISTRTIDRYVKKGVLSYKKVANKILLAQEEIDTLQNDFELLHQQEGMHVERFVETSSRALSTPQKGSSGSFGDVKEFVEILDKKDKTIEEKNQLIFILQHKIGELETQMKQMIALPDHSNQKDELLKNIQKLELERVELENAVRKEKLWNAVYVGLILIAAFLIIFFTF